MTFPDSFLWGAATASYQIEGAANEDGRGPSVWDMMCRKPGAVFERHTGDVACDHYHRYAEDVGLMGQMGIKAYRMSLSWSRILPDGVGAVNEKGIAFYDRLVDSLLAAGIEPYITLFHWDFPLELFYKGGWLNRDSADWFAEYVQLVAERLGDRVGNWMTHNEPQCFIYLGHGSGAHAPGIILPRRELLLAAHNAMRGHGKAVQALRAHAKRSARVGYAPCGIASMPASESAADIEAAKKATFAVGRSMSPVGEHWNSAWWMDPVYLGRYPEDGLTTWGDDCPKVRAGDMEQICQPLDFFAANIYHGTTVRAGSDGEPESAPNPIGFPTTAMGWPVTPNVLYWGSRFFHERYKLPIYITENGLANTDWMSEDGQVHDPQRIDFTQRYLRELRKASQDGADIAGYFHWSLMDNFEWAEGYAKRFGMIFVDYPTGKRTLKDSAKWYAKVIASNGAELDR